MAGKRAEIEAILKALYAANGGIGFFQDMAVLGSVYGFVDCVVRAGEQIQPIMSARLNSGDRGSPLRGCTRSGFAYFA